MPFVAQGIPGYGVLGAFDSTDTENPYPQQSPLMPPIFQYAGYDTPRDTIQHLNLLASGQPQGPATNDPNVPESGTEELRAALELPATWSDYLISRGRVRRRRAATERGRWPTSRPIPSSPRRTS